MGDAVMHYPFTLTADECRPWLSLIPVNGLGMTVFESVDTVTHYDRDDHKIISDTLYPTKFYH